MPIPSRASVRSALRYARSLVPRGTRFVGAVWTLHSYAVYTDALAAFRARPLTP